MAAAGDQYREQRNRLGELIEQRRADIEGRWLQQIQADVEPTGPHVSPGELRNAVGDYLERLAQALREDAPNGTGARASWKDVATEHAITRVRLGFDVGQLVHEFIVLRRIIAQAASGEENPPVRAADIIAELVESAIAEAVKSYVQSRDFAARRTQAEHVGFLTHELRNPLTTALVATSQLQRRPEVMAQAGGAVTLISRSLARLRGLIDHVLTAERLEAGQIAGDAKDVPLAELMRETLESARQQASERGLSLEVSIDPTAVVHVDPEMAISALQNVIDNAVKFTDEGTVRVVSESRPRAVALHVYDTCPGMTAQDMAHLFEPFQRGGSRKPGSGLGLAIARRAVEAIGGSIHAESTPEQGCHFWLVLPGARGGR